MTKIGECVMLEEVQKVLMSEDCGKKHNFLFCLDWCLDSYEGTNFCIEMNL